MWQKDTPAAKGAGFEDSYSTLLTCRGYLKKNSGTKVLNNGEIMIDDSYTLITDFIQNLYDNLQSDLQVVINSRVYSMNSWEQMDEKRFYLKFQLAVKK